MERQFLNDPTGLGNLAAEYDDQGNLISRYGYGLGLVAKDDHFYTFDGSGNTSEITSPAEEVVNTYAFDPFGTPLAETEGIANAFKFSGQFGVRQTNDDLLYMRNRFYSPSLGRFMTEDPIGLAGGDVGLYRYVQNDPVNFVDPDGQNPAQAVVDFFYGFFDPGPPPPSLAGLAGYNARQAFDRMFDVDVLSEEARMFTGYMWESYYKEHINRNWRNDPTDPYYPGKSQDPPRYVPEPRDWFEEWYGSICP